MIPAALALIAAPLWTLNGGATLVNDGGRESARIRHVNLYAVGEPQPMIGTLAFKQTLADHAGDTLLACVRSHATKRGYLIVWIERAVGGTVEIPTRVGTRYRTRCAEFTVVPVPRLFNGGVQVTNDGVTGRVDYIRHVSIRPTGA